MTSDAVGVTRWSRSQDHAFFHRHRGCTRYPAVAAPTTSMRRVKFQHTKCLSSMQGGQVDAPHSVSNGICRINGRWKKKLSISKKFQVIYIVNTTCFCNLLWLNQKTEQLSLRVSPLAKALLRTAASKQHRGAPKLVEHLALDSCEISDIQCASDALIAPTPDNE
jgi:hypothetical protein